MAIKKMPETCWILNDKEDIKHFHDYMENPEITPKGAELLERARKISKERSKREI